MRLTIELPDEIAERLRKQAASHGVSLEELVQDLAREKAQEAGTDADRSKARAAVTRILDIQKRVKPDPQGWTIRDYIDHGRP